MKRYTLTLFTLLVLTTISFGQLRFGAGISTVSFDAIGVQGKVLLDLEEKTGQPLDGAATFTYYLDNALDWSIDLDAHYRLITVAESIELDPIAGLNITRFGIGAFSDTEIGINLGANFTIPTDKFILYAQPKIVLGGIGDLVISAGILF